MFVISMANFSGPFLGVPNRSSVKLIALFLSIISIVKINSSHVTQVRDEYRIDYDEGRGGYGNIVKAQLTQRQQEMLSQMQEYEAGQDEDGDDEMAAKVSGKAANPRYRGDDSDED